MKERYDTWTYLKKKPRNAIGIGTALVLVLLSATAVWGRDLTEIKKDRVLRHLGIPYAHFVTGSSDGLDVELIRMFAESLSVKYEYVRTDWEEIFEDLTGKKIGPSGNDFTAVGDTPIKGDLAANGITVIPWRQKIVDFSLPTFPNQVWLAARADSTLAPIKPSGSLAKDIQAVKALLQHRTVLGKTGTCLDPSLYNLQATGAVIKLFSGSLNDIAPVIIRGEAELTLLDVPDALVALQKWAGKMKIIGPISERQDMAVAFAKESPKLREAFNRFFNRCQKDGNYMRLVSHYYPFASSYFPDFFKSMQ